MTVRPHRNSLASLINRSANFYKGSVHGTGYANAGDFLATLKIDCMKGEQTSSWSGNCRGRTCGKR
jgi:hypothetical protein